MRIFKRSKSKSKPAGSAGASGGACNPADIVGTVRIGKRDYAVNLQWELTEAANTAKRNARLRAGAPNINADYYCVRNAATLQFGLGFKRLGHRRSMPSLASQLAGEFSGNWLGLFELANGYYVLGVQNDGIFAETDLFFETMAAAGGCFLAIQNLMDWDKLYAPPDFQIEGAHHVNIQDLLPGNRGVRLKRVNRLGKGGKITLSGIFVATAMLVMAHVFGNPSGAVINALRELFANENPIVQQVQTAEPEIPPMPWAEKLAGGAVLAECVASIGAFAATVPGWTVSELICNGRKASARLQRDGEIGQGGGSAAWIQPFVRRNGFEPTVAYPQSGTGDLVEVNWNLGPLPTITDEIQAAPISIVRSALLRAFENRMTHIALNETDSAQYWRGLSFKFSTTVSPLGFDDIIAAIPAVIVESVHYGMETGLWTIEGKAYEKLNPQNNQTN